MSIVVRDGGSSTRPPHFPRNPRSRRRSRVGAAIAFAFTVLAFIVVACSGGNGDDGLAEFDEQGQRICNQDEGCEPPPHEPCGTEGNACCRLNNNCQAGLICFQGTCTACGTAGGPCCAGNTCNSGSACQGGTCVRTCGTQGLACCTSGPACDPGLGCSGGTCNPCGRGGQTCCAGSTCNSGFNCTAGTCTVCGGNGQTCCASGGCGGGLYCATGNTCRPIPCGTANGQCCLGVPYSQQCQLAGSQYACNQFSGRCEFCGSTNGPCCTTGQACTFPSHNVCDSSHRCISCGSIGQTCCAGNACDAGYACANSRCQICGGRSQPCCTSGTSCQSGLTCGPLGQCQ